MPETKAGNLRIITERVRALFQLMRLLAEDLHRDLGINASMRAVLEALQRDGPVTVPDMARVKRVSRQHIQINVDALAELRMVTSRPNPAHQRSPLIALTALGERTIAQATERERVLLDEMAAGIDAASLAATVEGLTRLQGELQRRVTRTISEMA